MRFTRERHAIPFPYEKWIIRICLKNSKSNIGGGNMTYEFMIILGSVKVSVTFYTLLLIYGFVSLLLGYRIYRVIFAVTGFITGFMTCHILLDGNIRMLPCLITGVILTFLCFLITIFGIFISGATLGALLYSMISAALFSHINIVLLIVTSLIFGGISILFRKNIIIFQTSLLGAIGIAYAMQCIITTTSIAEAYMEYLFSGGLMFGYQSILWYAVQLVLTVTGITVQLKCQTVTYAHQCKLSDTKI
jgi:hypothetical protein